MPSSAPPPGAPIPGAPHPTSHGGGAGQEPAGQAPAGQGPDAAAGPDAATRRSPVADLLAILDLEQLEVNLFRGTSPQVGWKRVFGGQVIGQALVAACRTVEGRQPHSMHAYFLLPGDPAAPIVYDVERIRDGRSFTTRRVKAIQHGAAIFSLSASFQVDEAGHEHEAPMPRVPGPEDLAGALPAGEGGPGSSAMGVGRPGAPPRGALADALAALPEAVRLYYKRERPIELRPVEVERYTSRAPREPRFHMWLRATERLPDDPVLHRCVLAYASDMTLLDAALIAHGKTVFDADVQAASLDHAMWFHRPFRADEWLLYAQDSPFSGGARGFARGAIYDRAGHLVASVAQEGLIRPRAPRAGGA